MTAPDDEPLLSIQELVTEFTTPDGTVQAVDHVSYDLYPGEILGVVGESGSGKSVTVMSVLGLIPQPPGRIPHGRILFEGRDLLTLSRREMRKVRGDRISMIFQDPMTSLNPVLKIGRQIAESLTVHAGMNDRDARARAIELLEVVGVPSPHQRFDQYPHQFSGGMRQRALIAMAIANQPRVIIADEPTTALDVTIQAQVLEALKLAQAETHAATILITHDLGLIADLADRVVVMYAGKVVETADVHTLFRAPRHPYTLGLLSSLPRMQGPPVRLHPIPGSPPSLINRPSGCAFHPRCELSRGRRECREELPPIAPVGDGHWSACHFADEVPAEVQRIRMESKARDEREGRAS